MSLGVRGFGDVGVGVEGDGVVGVDGDVSEGLLRFWTPSPLQSGVGGSVVS